VPCGAAGLLTVIHAGIVYLQIKCFAALAGVTLVADDLPDSGDVRLAGRGQVREHKLAGVGHGRHSLRAREYGVPATCGPFLSLDRTPAYAGTGRLCVAPRQILINQYRTRKSVFLLRPQGPDTVPVRDVREPAGGLLHHGLRRTATSGSADVDGAKLQTANDTVAIVFFNSEQT